jgi:uncharacterized protein (DUF305 family)
VAEKTLDGSPADSDEEPGENASAEDASVEDASVEDEPDDDGESVEGESAEESPHDAKVRGFLDGVALARTPARRRGVAVLTAVVLLLIGLVAGVLIGRPWYPGDSSVDAGFARDMSTHHAQAVSMATTTYGRSTDQSIRQLAVDIALTQQAQIGIMKDWLDTWRLSPTGDDPPMTWMGHEGMTGMAGMSHNDGDGNLMPGMANAEEMAKLEAATGKNVDILFCQLMLRHHLGGIDMAKYAVEHASEHRVVELAQSMVNAQEAETVILREDLRRLGAQPLPYN